MLHLLLIVVFAASALGGEHAHGAPVMPLAPMALVVCAPMLMLAALGECVAWSVGRAMDRRGDLRTVRWYERTMTLGRTLAVGLHVYDVLVLGWLDSIRAALSDAVVLDELVCVAPVLGVIVAGWWSGYGVDLRIRHALLLRDIDRGEPVHAPPGRARYVWMQCRHQLLPVALPMLGLIGWREGVDRLVSFPEASSSLGRWLDAPGRAELVAGVLDLGGVLGALALMPMVLTRLWDTVPLGAGEMLDRLSAMCRLHGVRVRRLLVWRTGGMMVNGAVVGFTPSTRYILLTDQLLESLPGPQVEAVMAHEIAHARLWHVPWLGGALIAGVGVCSALVEVLLHAGGRGGAHDAAGQWAGVGLGLVGGVVIFGWISRRFEWQADAFAAAHATRCAGASAVTHEAAADMCGALEGVARLNRLPVERFTFRHGSIATRLARLRELVGQPIDALAIDTTVRRIKWGTGLALGALIALVVLQSMGVMP